MQLADAWDSYFFLPALAALRHLDAMQLDVMQAADVVSTDRVPLHCHGGTAFVAIH
jgi:hypothetical protein